MHRRQKNNAEAKRIQTLKGLFKKVVRMVSLNDPFKETDDDPRITSNVTRNLSTRVRARRKLGFLSTQEKSLIRIPHIIRTIPDRMKLCTLFARIPCFSRFSPKIRARLVPVIRLMSVDAGRNIIRQSDNPITVFFILTGEVHMIREENKREDEDALRGILGPGDMMGDVELLEGIKRSYTFKAATYCELLVLFDYDFKSVLGSYMTKTWDEKKRALKALDYFDFLDNEQIVEACRYGRLKQFEPLDTIFAEDIGSMTNVHFVLSGECLILQCLNMRATFKKGKKFYELLTTSEGDVSRLFKHGVRSTFSSPPKSENASKRDILELIESSSSSFKENGDNTIKSRKMRKMQLRDIEKSCGLRKSEQPPKKRFTWRRSTRKSEITPFSHTTQEVTEEDIYEDYWELCQDDDDDEIEISSSDSVKLSTQIRAAPVLNSYVGGFYDGDDPFSSSLSSLISDSDQSYIPTFESRFIDVGTLTFGAIFGLGEKMEHRVIMARTTVQCLTLPRFFLLEKKQNPGNIWERRLLYMECMIPSREALFTHFLKTCDWKKFKNNFIRETLKYSENNNIAHEGDIPIICRIVESSEDVN
ncbi:uncharacterized protein LOC108116287 isoform X1 [Drosophila eugracilis]|uniref:uncharacterized protein LOC108116287 isoform X1 n=1 Tax=Drosophila eugracilis TaxID=29029 RepID=UPI001BDAC6ED|nr:uncharacterized protein LOC108116287 isoform X1 [Drosophila eugracilis]